MSTKQPWEMTKEELKSTIFIPGEGKKIFNQQKEKYGKSWSQESNYEKIKQYIKDKTSKKSGVLIKGNIVRVGDNIRYMTLYGKAEGIVKDIKIEFWSVSYEPIYKLKVMWPTTAPNKKRVKYLWIDENYGPAKINGSVDFKDYVCNILEHSYPLERYQDYIKLMN